ncbi:hypothetical protein FQN54_005567 [Arachnomyces sp. PD_36]|nr:hypothetical protein FQN54_005567 [Arachnomyces sp. PD_36]
MFSKKPSQSHSESFNTSSKYRAGKSSSRPKRSFSLKETTTRRVVEKPRKSAGSPPTDSTLTSAIITLCVGPEQRLFAAHEDVLCNSPFFEACCRGQFLESHSKKINLPEEQPEVLSSILEYLYKGDYYPRLMHNKRRDSWELEDASSGSGESTVAHQAAQAVILKDTAIYCAAEKYGLDELKRLALRKQGLQSGVQCSTIMSSARYAYANTPDSDSKLRAHYLALIIRSRSTFKRSGTMQMEMEAGGKLFFDLFVAMCNHMDDLTTSKSPFPSPFTR